HLGGEVAIRVCPALAGLGRDVDERLLLAARREVAIDRVVAEIRASADEPSSEWRSCVVEHRRERRLPVDEGGLGSPEGVAIGDRPAMEVLACSHRFTLHRRSPYRQCRPAGKAYGPPEAAALRWINSAATGSTATGAERRGFKRNAGYSIACHD